MTEQPITMFARGLALGELYQGLRLNSMALLEAIRQGAITDADIPGLRDRHDHWEAEFRRIRDEEPQNIAATLHQLMDSAIRWHQANDKQARKVRCSEGCAHCCKLHTGITEAEGVLLRIIAARKGIHIDRARLARQAGVRLRNWHELDAPDRRCVFLGADDRCKVYAHRPMACRKYFVTSKPSACSTDDGINSQVTVFVAWNAEIVYSAAVSVFGLGGMADMLFPPPAEADLT